MIGWPLPSTVCPMCLRLKQTGTSRAEQWQLQLVTHRRLPQMWTQQGAQMSHSYPARVFGSCGLGILGFDTYTAA